MKKKNEKSIWYEITKEEEVKIKEWRKKNKRMKKLWIKNKSNSNVKRNFSIFIREMTQIIENSHV